MRPATYAEHAIAHRAKRAVCVRGRRPPRALPFMATRRDSLSRDGSESNK